MSTVIVGGGIIGVSIAYYLSELDRAAGDQKREIHIVEVSADLFASASGYAAGFLARDWFAPELAELGELSFDLHRKFAEDHDGLKLWGYMESTSLSLRVTGKDGKRSPRGDDWLRRGASRAEVAVRDSSSAVDDPSPAWLTKQLGGTVKQIGNDGSTAQVDPLRLCQLLLDKCLERGVHLHQPARVTALVRSTDAVGSIGVRIKSQKPQDNAIYTIPCTNLVFAAGAWTPKAFDDIFPGSNVQIPITALSGYSLLLRSPRHKLTDELKTYGGKVHAVFTTHPQACGFSPEIASRAGTEIYIAGLNSSTIPLPSLATESRNMMQRDKIANLKKAAVVLMGKPPSSGASLSEDENLDDLEVIREGLCFRPWTESGLPIIGRIDDRSLCSGETPAGGVFVVAGHGPWGISLSLGTGKVVTEMLLGLKTSADVSELGLDDRTARHSPSRL